MPIAPADGDRADACRCQRPGSGCRPKPVRPGHGGHGGRGRPRGRWRAGQGEVAGGGEQRHRDHAVGVGAQPAEQPDVLDQHPVGQAQHAEGDDARAGSGRGRAGQEHRADHGERRDGEQVDGESVRLVERGERVDPGGQDMRLRGGSHRLGHPGQGAWLAVHGSLPEPPPRPRLQDRHAYQEQPRAAQGRPAQPPGTPGARRAARSGRLPPRR